MLRDHTVPGFTRDFPNFLAVCAVATGLAMLSVSSLQAQTVATFAGAQTVLANAGSVAVALGRSGNVYIQDNGWSPLDNLDKIKGSLEKAGFSLQAGSEEYVEYMDWVKETCERNMQDTAFNNPAPNAYATLVLPVHQGTVIPPGRWLWQLDEQEAIVIVGRTPPEAAYFSYQTILGFLPISPWPPQSPGFLPTRVAPSVGDAINIGTIKTLGPDKVKRPIVIVITGHRGTEKAVRRALLAGGVPDAVINVETISPALGALGTKDKGSWFYWAHRVSVPKSESEVLDYLKTVGDQLKVFRVRPNQQLAQQLGKDPEPIPVLRVRGTGHTEMDLYPAVLRLRQAILDHYRATPYKELDTHVFSATAWDGQEVLAEKPYAGLQRGITSLGVTRDTNYLGTYPTFMLRQGVPEFVIVYGVNHQKTGKVTYAAVGAYANEVRWFGIGTALSPTFEGSANAFLPGDPDADKLYVLKVARDCTGVDHCLQINPPKFVDLWGNPYPTNPTCALDDLSTPEKTEIPFNLDQERLFFIFRSYMEPSTLVGPDDNEL
ncbi:MAG: hypothetical protein LLG20_15820, partial [Acidobacteriales bacterium]|nr:hypothetical protein [Terriglobales bacterium]